MKGYTIIEVVISILLTAVMVSAVFSVALSSRQSGGKSDRKLLAAQASKTLSMVLRSYVTGEPANTVIAGPNAARNLLPGPPFAPEMWHVHTPGVQTDSQGDVYALAPYPNQGSLVHRLDCLLPNDSGCFLPKLLRDPPYNGTIQYTVTVPAANAAPQVSVDVNWTEP